MSIEKQQQILIVEDEVELAGMLKYLMEQEGFKADIEYNGESAIRSLKANVPDMIILDLMLPQMDGFEVYRQMRHFAAIPVLILSAKMHDDDIVKGLEIGADDYMTKPFNNKELALRVKKILGHATATKKVSSKLEIGDIKIDFAAKEVFLKGNTVALTPTEYNLLSYMALNEGATHSWESLLKEVWGHDEWSGGNKLVKVSVGRLRKKLEEGLNSSDYLLTVWGMGYKLVNPLVE